MAGWLEKIAGKSPRRIVGLMSGTSADGVDAAVVEVVGSGRETQARIEAFDTTPLSPPLRQKIFDLFEPEASLDDLCSLNFALGDAFGEAALQIIEAAGMTPGDVDLIGSHGQTIRHLPSGSSGGSTLQIAEPAVIAQRTGIVTIADFRPADLAVGGQGAPLVPLVDYLLFAHPSVGRGMLNIGGIANITVLPPGAQSESTFAFDLGPGNLLVDAAVSYFSEGAERFDVDGRRAAAGSVDEGLLATLMQHEFIQHSPPKSTGRDQFGVQYFRSIVGSSSLPANDLIATLTTFAAEVVAAGIEKFVRPRLDLDELWVSGGGVHNPYLMRSLQSRLPDINVESLERLGYSPDAKEAMAFAVLANETLMGNCGNLPSATGAREAAILGKIVPAKSERKR